MKNTRWWMWSAALIAVLMVALAVGSLIDNDGPRSGQLILAVVMFGAAAFVATGIRKRSNDRTVGNRLVGFGVIPGVVGLAFFWFPPAVAVGVLSIVTSVAAFRDAKGYPSAVRVTGYGAVLLVLVLTVISVGVA